MATKVTESDIIKMLELYSQLGTYAAVAREIGFSASTVRKYILLNKDETPIVPIEKIQFNIEIPAPTKIDFPKNWGDVCILSGAEAEEMHNLWKEMKI